MANTQYEAYQRQFDSTLMHLVEMDTPFLMDGVVIDTDIEGQTKVFKRIGTLTGQRKTGRNEVAVLQEPDYSARHLVTNTDYVATPIDMDDVIKMVNNPQDDLYQECVNALYELQTKEVMKGFFADVIVTEAGGSTSSFAAGNQVAVNYNGGPFGQNSGAANVGLNIDKLLRVKSLVSTAKVRVNTTAMNTLNIAVCEDDIQDLMSTKYGTDQYPLVDKLNTLVGSFGKAAEQIIDGKFYWQGFHFHVVPPQYFELDGSGHRRLPVWIKDGFVYGQRTAIESEIVKLPNTVESTKIQVLTRHGSLRKHDSKVYEIKVAV